MSITNLESRFDELFSFCPSDETLEDIQQLVNSGNVSEAVEDLRAILQLLSKDLSQFQKLMIMVNNAQTNLNMANGQMMLVRMGLIQDATNVLNQVIQGIPNACKNLKLSYKIDIDVARLEKLKETFDKNKFGALTKSVVVNNLDSAFEVLMGDKPKYEDLPTIKAKVERLKEELNLYENCVNSARSVGKISISNHPIDHLPWFGSGFITEDDYVYTNYHVFIYPTHEEKLGRKATKEELKSAIENAQIEFGFETVDGEGKLENIYTFDADDFEFSHYNDLDYVKVKVKGNPSAIWGSLSIDITAPIEVGAKVPIIQHPRGTYQKVVLEANTIKGYYANDSRKILYSTDTEGGSSGSPVFNMNWKVIALHHAGMRIEDGGFLIDGEAESANRGVLFKAILGQESKKFFF